MKVELETLKQNLQKLREENNKEEEKLKRNKQDAEQYLDTNMGIYDHLMEEGTKEKAELIVYFCFKSSLKFRKGKIE